VVGKVLVNSTNFTAQKKRPADASLLSIATIIGMEPSALQRGFVQHLVKQHFVCSNVMFCVALFTSPACPEPVEGSLSKEAKQNSLFLHSFSDAEANA